MIKIVTCEEIKKLIYAVALLGINGNSFSDEKKVGELIKKLIEKGAFEATPQFIKERKHRLDR